MTRLTVVDFDREISGVLAGGKAVRLDKNLLIVSGPRLRQLKKDGEIEIVHKWAGYDRYVVRKEFVPCS